MKLPRRTDHPSVTERLIEHGWSVMIFDGDCVLCSSAVRFIAHRTRHKLVAFCASQSNAGHENLAAINDANRIKQTIVVLTAHGHLRRSDAVIHLLGKMHNHWPILASLLGAIPRRIRDAGYSFIARNRYRVFGRRRQCMLSREDMQRRFVL